MNDLSRSSDMIKQLKSLSIDREALPGVQERQAGQRAFPVRKASLWVCLLIAATGLAAWHFDMSPSSFLDQERNPTLADPAVVPVQPTAEVVVAPASAIAEPAVIGSGYVIAARELQLTGSVGGWIERMTVETGDRVTAGQVIAVLNSDKARNELRIADARLAMALAELARIEAQRLEATANLERRRTLAERGSVPAVEVAAAEFSQTRIDRDLDVATQAVAIATLERDQRADVLQQHEVKAPFDAVVVKRHMNPGEISISPMDGGPAQPIVTLMDPHRFIIEVEVAESHLARVSTGQTATVRLDAYPTRDFAAVVKTISPRLSLQRGTVEVRLEFKTPPSGVFANMAARVTFTASEPSQLNQMKGY